MINFFDSDIIRFAVNFKSIITINDKFIYFNLFFLNPYFLYFSSEDSDFLYFVEISINYFYLIFKG